MKRLTQPKLFESDMDRSAEFSPCRMWRYSLYRCWDWQGPEGTLAFCCLNPSGADERLDDNTVTRCIRYAKRWGFGGFCMYNVFGFRATDPKVMQAAADPVGPGNDEALAGIRKRAGCVVAGWGNHCPPEREKAVCGLIGGSIFCLNQTQKGRPIHPLYQKLTETRKLFYDETNAIVQ